MSTEFARGCPGGKDRKQRSSALTTMNWCTVSTPSPLTSTTSNTSFRASGWTSESGKLALVALFGSLMLNNFLRDGRCAGRWLITRRNHARTRVGNYVKHTIAQRDTPEGTCNLAACVQLCRQTSIICFFRICTCNDASMILKYPIPLLTVLSYK